MSGKTPRRHGRNGAPGTASTAHRRTWAHLRDRVKAWWAGSPVAHAAETTHWRLCCAQCARERQTLYLWLGLCWCRHCLPADARPHP